MQNVRRLLLVPGNTLQNSKSIKTNECLLTSSVNTFVFTLNVLLNNFTQLFWTDFRCGLIERAISRIKHQKGSIYCMKSKLLFSYEGPWCQKADSKCWEVIVCQSCNIFHEHSVGQMRMCPQLPEQLSFTNKQIHVKSKLQPNYWQWFNNFTLRPLGKFISIPFTLYITTFRLLWAQTVQRKSTIKWINFKFCFS